MRRVSAKKREFVEALILLIDFADEEDDPMLKDLLNDPVMQTDFDLIKFTQNFSRDDTFKDFLVHLNETEKEILRSIEVKV